MKFKEYLKKLNDIAEQRPEVLDFDVVCADDDEGNGFRKVHYTAQIGNYDEVDKHFEEEKVLNAICIN